MKSSEKRRKRSGLAVTLLFHVLVGGSLFLLSFRIPIKETAKPLNPEIHMDFSTGSTAAAAAPSASAAPSLHTQPETSIPLPSSDHLPAQQLSPNLADALNAHDLFHTDRWENNTLDEGNEASEGSTKGNIDLADRKCVKKPFLPADFAEEGIVVVKIKVSRFGKVVSAKVDLDKSTTASETLHRLAIKQARTAVFEENFSAPIEQYGSITFNFQLSDR